MQRWPCSNAGATEPKLATVGDDKGYNCKAFIKGCRKCNVTPHVAAKANCSAIGRSHEMTRGLQAQSLKVRKRIEEAFGWIKTVGAVWPRPKL